MSSGATKGEGSAPVPRSTSPPTIPLVESGRPQLGVSLMALGVATLALRLGLHGSDRAIVAALGFMGIGAGLALALGPLGAIAGRWLWPATAPGTTTAAGRKALERAEWGRRYFRARHEWNTQEGLLYLRLDLREEGVVGLIVRVRAPGGHDEKKGPFSGGTLVRVPTDFVNAAKKHA